MNLELTDKVVIVTGGSDGLGRATVERLANEGAQVIACARREDHLQTAVSELKASTEGSITAVAMDVTSEDDCKRTIDTAIREYGRIDALVNNAGTSAAHSFESLSDKQWQADIELKLMGAVRMCRHALPHLRDAGGGSIINATIGGAKAPNACALPTSVTRAAGLNLTKSLANEYAADNIRVNSVCIGYIKSAQWVRRAGEKPVEDLYDSLAAKVPLGRVGEACNYADLVAFLCSARATYITGTAINLDGGMCPVL